MILVNKVRERTLQGFTQDLYPGMGIPRSFNLTAGGHEFWLHGNATEHLAETVVGYANKLGTSLNDPRVLLYEQSLLEDVQGMLANVSSKGITYGETITMGNWEVIVSAPRQAGLNPAVIHLQPITAPMK